MNRNYEELAEWCSDARRGLEREVEHLQEKQEQMTNYMRALSATEELSSQLGDLNEELERKQAENDRLSDELDAKQAELDALQVELERKQAEIDRLLLEQQLAEAEAKPADIHNPFEGGSTAQVFNDQVTGRFSKIKKWRIEKCEKKKKKRENTKREKRKAS